MPRRCLRASLLLLGFALLAGCGQKGDLVLPSVKPDTAAPVQPTNAATPASAASVPAPATPPASS